MATHGDLVFDRRVQLEALTLARAGHRVTLFCLQRGGALPTTLTQAVTIVERRSSTTPKFGAIAADRQQRGGRLWHRLRRGVTRVRWLVDYRRELLRWGMDVAEAGRGADVWHLHDFPALLAIAPRLAPARAFVYDSHELFFEAGSAARLPRPIRWWFRRIERRLVRRSSAVVTVNASCAAVLRHLVPSRIVVVHNCPPSVDESSLHDRPLRRSIGVAQDVPLVLYHGIFGPSRGIEELIEAMSRPELRHAHLALLGYGMLRPAIDALVAGSAAEHRIHVLDAVQPDELSRWIVGADVEALPIQRSSLNHYLATPNKLFEAIAVGLPVVVSDFPGMRSIVIDDPAGPLGGTCVPSDPGSIAKAVADILALPTDDRSDLRRRCLLAARERWNWERESTRLVDLYRDIGAEARQSMRSSDGTGDDPRGS